MMNESRVEHTKQIPRELEGLETNIRDLKEALNVLEEAISPILTEPDPPEASGGEDTGSRCDLADMIAAYRQRVGELVLFVRALPSRVEL
jgi:hypothetical protein